jgi:hypothetical protein
MEAEAVGESKARFIALVVNLVARQIERYPGKSSGHRQ